MGQTIDMINNGEYVMGLAQERIHARSRRKTNIRTGPKAAGKGSSKGKKSPKETKRSKGAGKGSGSKKERRQRSFGFFSCIACLDLYEHLSHDHNSMQWQCRKTRQLPQKERQSLL
jgi:hypothetical protein